MTEISDRLLRIVFDVAVGSMDFGSGFLDDEEVGALREVAVILGADPADATPRNFLCKFRQRHDVHIGLHTPMFTGPDGVLRNAYRLRIEFPADVQASLQGISGADDLGILRAPAILTWCPDCGRNFDVFEDTRYRAGNPVTAMP